MNMLTNVAADTEFNAVRTKFAKRPVWQRGAIVGTPLLLLAAAVTFWPPPLIISLVTAGVLSRRRKDGSGAPATMRSVPGSV